MVLNWVGWILGSCLLVANIDSAQASAPTLAESQVKVYEMGRELGNHIKESDREEAQLTFKKAIRTILYTRTAGERIDNWLGDRTRFMMAETFVVAVAIAATNAYSYPGEDNVLTWIEIAKGILAGNGIIAAVYLPYRQFMDSLANHKNQVLLNEMFRGLEETAEGKLPEAAIDKIEWLERRMGESEWLLKCEKLLVP